MSAKPGTEPLTGRDWILGLLTFIGFWIALALALMGAWVATSLTVYNDGPTWLAIVGAVACFFVVPLVWELIADRKQVGGRITDAILRSGVLSAIFLIVIVATHAESTFKALATRGDWFLASPRGGERDGVRGFLWSVANGYEWLYNAVRTKAFDLPEGDPNLLPDDVFVAPVAPVQPTVSAREVDLPTGQAPIDPPAKTTPTPSEPKVDTAPVTRTLTRPIPNSDWSWPLDPTPHPAALSVPPEATTIAAIGKYLASAEPNPLLRARAVHDVVATRIAYSAKELRDGSYKGISQEAKDVLARGNGVCAGYSKLMVALGKAADLKIVYVSGDTRTLDDLKAHNDVSMFVATSSGHAWNAVEIDKQWYLIDATWNAGHVNGDTFTAKYGTTYLFIPPEVMILDHIPHQKRFQLLSDPIDMATWWRQPFIEPAAFSLGLVFKEGMAPITKSAGKFRVVVDNPLEAYLSLGIASDNGTNVPFCAEITNEKVATLECDIAEPGQYAGYVGASRVRYGSYWRMAETVHEVTR